VVERFLESPLVDLQSLGCLLLPFTSFHIPLSKEYSANGNPLMYIWSKLDSDSFSFLPMETMDLHDNDIDPVGGGAGVLSKTLCDSGTSTSAKSNNEWTFAINLECLRCESFWVGALLQKISGNGRSIKRVGFTFKSSAFLIIETWSVLET